MSNGTPSDGFTPNYSLILPVVGGSDDTWAGKLNSNFSVLDTQLYAVSQIGGVSSFDGRTGAIVLQASDITLAGGALLASSPTFTGTVTAANLSVSGNEVLGTITNAPTWNIGQTFPDLTVTEIKNAPTWDVAQAFPAVTANNLTVTNTSILAGASATTLNVTGASTLAGATTVSNTLNVTANATLAGIVGKTDGSNALTGNVGEFINSSVATNAVSLTTATTATVTSISLTAGDWDVNGEVWFVPSVGGTVYIGAINTAASLPAAPGAGVGRNQLAGLTAAAATAVVAVAPCRISVSATTVVYLVGQATFGSGTCTAGGTINARRVR